MFGKRVLLKEKFWQQQSTVCKKQRLTLYGVCEATFSWKMAYSRVSPRHPHADMLLSCLSSPHLCCVRGGGNSSAQGPLYFGQLVTAWQMMSYSFYVSRMRTVVCVFQSHRVSAWKLERHLGVYCWIWGACCITRILSLCAETTVDWINSRSVNWHEGEKHSWAILSQAHTAGSSVRKQKLKML